MNYYNSQIENMSLRLNLYGPIGANPMLGSSGVTAAAGAPGSNFFVSASRPASHSSESPS